MRTLLIKKRDPGIHWVLACLFFFSVFVRAQSEEKFIGEVRVMNVVEAECTLKDGRYEIRFRDAKKRRFPKYASFYFPDKDKNYNKLKNKVLTGFEDVPKEPEQLDFTEEKVELQFSKSSGMVSFRFAILQGKKDKRTYSSWFSKGKAEKIFGI